ncbi:hypothetical protein RIF29_38317 [Crotalaria pallida]|uniref:Uncharacterized protein n=1 Tax=Crotalaria pallida TaxID=3830 RepID=A0AAN9E212_CROPI
MAKKKGRPPKSPSPHTPTPTKIPKSLDLQHIDDEDLEDIDALSPKKAASILQKLDELRSMIKGKAVADDPKATDEPIEEQPDAHSLAAKENIDLLKGERRDCCIPEIDIQQGRVLTPSQQLALLKPVEAEEIKLCFFQMGDDKAPGPDGYGAAFYKAAWPVISSNVVEAV